LKTKQSQFEMSTIAHLFQNAAERARMGKNAVQNSANYAKQGWTQNDWASPHLAPYGLPQVPVWTQDKRLSRGPQGAGFGGALTPEDIRRVLDVRIRSLKDAREDAEKRGIKILSGPSTAPTTAALARQEASVLSLQETLASLTRLLESGLASSKLLEKSTDLLDGVARLAPVLTPEESGELAAGIRDAADEAEAQYSEMSAEEAQTKAGRVKEATTKLLRDILTVLESGVAGPPQNRAARVKESRREIARRPGREAKARRAEDRQARADAEAEIAEARARAAAAAADEDAVEAAERADAAAAAARGPGVAAPGVRRARAAANVGPSPARTAAARRRANAERAADEAARALPPLYPAKGTQPYRTLVDVAFKTAGRDALQNLVEVYRIPVEPASTKAAMRAALLQ
jgi:hypothetical protein